MSYLDIDENGEIAPDLDDDKFVHSREIILRLLPKLFRDGSSKFTELAPIERLIDEVVEEIARIWIDEAPRNT